MAEPRLLQAIAGGDHGGAEAFFVRLACAFGRAGVAQRLLVRRGRDWIDTLREADLDLHELAFGGALDVTTRAGFRRHIADFRPTVVLTWMNRATRFCPRDHGPSIHLARLGGYYDLKYYRSCDHLIGNTQDIVRYLCERGWPAERAHYVPNFVDASPAPPLPRASLDTPEDAPLVLALGRLHRNKAFDILLRAMTHLPTAYLWLAGDGPLDDALRKQAAALGIKDRVRFLGWRRDIAALLGAADLLACPSRIEPLGNVVIEGWAHGVPVVAAASKGPAALIDPGESGLIVPLEDAEALATSIAAVFENETLAQRLVEAGRNAYESAFTEDAVVSRYRALFEQVSVPCAA